MIVVPLAYHGSHSSELLQVCVGRVCRLRHPSVILSGGPALSTRGESLSSSPQESQDGPQLDFVRVASAKLTLSLFFASLAR